MLKASKSDLTLDSVLSQYFAVRLQLLHCKQDSICSVEVLLLPFLFYILLYYLFHFLFQTKQLAQHATYFS